MLFKKLILNSPRYQIAFKCHGKGFSFNYFEKNVPAKNGFSHQSVK